MSRFLFARNLHLEEEWPFLPERLTQNLQSLGQVQTLLTTDAPLSEQEDLREVVGIAYFGGQITEQCLDHAPQLRVIGGVFDRTGYGLPLETLFARNIIIIDATPAWAPSVAELGLCLALCALRRVPWWHQRMANREPLWHYEASQFCDDREFVNGDLGTKRVGVVGLGQIGRRVAQGCQALGAEVKGYDPFLPQERLSSWGITPVSLDALVEWAEVLFLTVPPTPSAQGMINKERIDRLQKGAIVVLITRTAVVDMKALRERILANEIFGAFDVYDIEPLPVEDSLRGRGNVVHTPHIAGRTRDANLRVADIITEDFRRVLQGEQPLAQLTREMIEVRTKISEVPKG